MSSNNSGRSLIPQLSGVVPNFQRQVLRVSSRSNTADAHNSSLKQNINNNNQNNNMSKVVFNIRR